MNIVVLTVEERLYLPAFFARLFAQRTRDIRAVFLAPMRHGKQSKLQMINKYRAAFGWWNLFKLVRREAAARLFDRLNVGRSQGRFYSITSVAEHYGLTCDTVQNVNADEFLQRLRELQTDLIVSVSCPQIFRKPLIDLPSKGCLNIHTALLPEYRGLAPSFWMMLDGENHAGVTVFMVNEDIDAGDVVDVEEFPIHLNETLEQFIIRSKRIGCDVLLRAIQRIEDGSVQTTPLDTSRGSYYGFPTREDYRKFRARGRRLW